MVETPKEADALPSRIGRYTVSRLIGEGAMGRVLLAHDPVLDREVAIKHLRADLQLPRDARDALVVRMRHEARAAARVAHPNLVVLHDMGEDETVGLFLVFEYVAGPTLKERLAEGALAPSEAARLAREIGAALTLAHEAGVLHRDVKPENVMLAAAGAKIADFGIARVPDSTLTHQGGLLGTPAYSAPETFDAGMFSPASDQFSLAATVYEAISGRRAFPGDDAISVAAKIKNDVPSGVAADLGVSSAVDRVLLRALSQSPDARFPSCAAFGEALARALGGAPSMLDAKEVGVDELPRERKLGQVLLGAAVVLVTAALLVRAAIQSAERSALEDAAASSRPVPTAAAPVASVEPERPVPPAPRRHAKPHESAAPEAAQSATASPAPTPTPSASASASAPAIPTVSAAPAR